MPLFELPAATGLRILQLASKSVPYRIAALHEIRDELRAMAPAEE